MSASPQQLEALSEIMNIGVGQAAELLYEMLGSRILLQVPDVRVVALPDLDKDLPELATGTLASVEMAFRGHFNGTSALLFPPQSASTLVSVLTQEGGAQDDLDSIRAATLTEVGNIVLNGVMGALANTLSAYFTYQVPTYAERSVRELCGEGAGHAVVMARTRFRAQSLEIEGDILLVLEIGSLDALLLAIDRVAAAG